MLASISSYVTRCVSVISRITGIDVEVVDDRMNRIAGTGIYADAVGHSIATAGQIYRHVLAKGEAVHLVNPRLDPICQGCPSMPECREKLTFSTPIKVGERCVGVLGLVCFTDEDRAKVLDNFENYAYFIDQIAALIGSRLKDRLGLTKARRFTDLMSLLMDLSDRGVIVFNNLGQVFYINSRARAELGLGPDEDPAGLSAQTTGERMSEYDEFVIIWRDQRSVVMGQRHLIPFDDPDVGSVLVFNTLTKLKDQISSLAYDASGPGLDVIIGASENILKLKAQIKQVAQSTSTVLITGESGTGKELVARAIHAESARLDQPFIAINCGAIPETLLESELFGYAKGAFSGASPKGRMGKFELANRGVLFLDEIGTLPIYLQVKLLRVLQERQLCRLGSNVLMDIDVRIIAATNADLTESIRQGMFREDLYYRLNVIPMELPPLRERLADLEPLASHFLGKYAALFNKSGGAVGGAVLAALSAYDWPGNVRELENAIEFAVNMMPDNGFLSVEHLPNKIFTPSGLAHKPKAAETPAAPGLVEPLALMERRAIQRALSLYGADSKAKARAAKDLGIGVATLYRKIKEHQLT